MSYQSQQVLGMSNTQWKWLITPNTFPMESQSQYWDGGGNPSEESGMANIENACHNGPMWGHRTGSQPDTPWVECVESQKWPGQGLNLGPHQTVVVLYQLSYQALQWAQLQCLILSYYTQSNSCYSLKVLCHPWLLSNTLPQSVGWSQDSTGWNYKGHGVTGDNRLMTCRSSESTKMNYEAKQYFTLPLSGRSPVGFQ